MLFLHPISALLFIYLLDLLKSLPLKDHVERPPSMSNDKKDVVVIGAGMGGMATAARLAKKGYRVQVFEAERSPRWKMSN